MGLPLLQERVSQNWNRDKVIGFYNDVDGDLRAFKRAVRSEFKLRGLDPMTILVLMQLAIKLYFWLKQNNFIKFVPTNAFESAPSLEALYEMDIPDDGNDDNE